MSYLRFNDDSGDCPHLSKSLTDLALVFSTDLLTAEQWGSLTEDQRREVDQIARNRVALDVEPWDQMVARIDAGADAATVAVFDALVAGDLAADDDVGADDGVAAERGSCAVPLLRRAGSSLETVWLPCGRRTCPVCCAGWRAGKLADLGAVVDQLSGSTMDAPTIAVHVEAVHDDDLRAVLTKIRRHGFGCFHVPLEGAWRLVLTDDPAVGAPRPAVGAIEAAAGALVALSERSDERRQVRFSKSWQDIAALCRPVELEDDQDDDVEWLGVATKAATPAKVAAAARRSGGIAGPVVPRDVDPAGARCWRAKVPPDREWLFLELVGFKSWHQIAEERAIRRAERAFAEQERELQRRRSAERAARLVAA